MASLLQCRKKAGVTRDPEHLYVLLGFICWVLKLCPDFVSIIGEGSHGTQPWVKNDTPIRKTQRKKCSVTSLCPRIVSLVTSDQVVHAPSKGHPGIGDFCSPDLGALHPHQDQSRAEERQDDGDDDEGATHVDVP